MTPDVPSAGRRDPHAKDAALWDPPATLTGGEYWSAEVFELERDRLFQGSWYCVGRAEDAPDPVRSWWRTWPARAS